jgi:hypothetical protein
MKKKYRSSPSLKLKMAAAKQPPLAGSETRKK